MEALFWASTQPLNSVHPMEEPVVRLREQLAATLSSALAPVQAYLGKLEAHEDLLRLNAEQYVAALDAKGEELSLNEVRVWPRAEVC